MKPAPADAPSPTVVRFETPEAPRLFRSFFIAGFECSCQINSRRKRLDMMAAVGHDRAAAEDYARLRELGVVTARDGVRWHLIDREGVLDFSSFLPMLRAAEAGGIQVIWDLFHYGWPDDLDLFSPEFVPRFTRYARAVARLVREETQGPAFYTPVNEISFMAWAAARRIMFPYAFRRDGEIKRILVRCAVEAATAIRDADPRARIATAEPLIHAVPKKPLPRRQAQADAKNASQFEAFDMLAASSPGLDIVGLNFYAANQWEVPGGRKLHWDDGSNDPRWKPLRELLAEVWARYRRPLYLAETSHYGIGRADWLREIVREVTAAVESGVPVEGVCLYPVLDRFDWENPRHWHNSGLFNMIPDGDAGYRRELHAEYAGELAASRKRLKTVGF